MKERYGIPTDRFSPAELASIWGIRSDSAYQWLYWNCLDYKARGMGFANRVRCVAAKRLRASGWTWSRIGREVFGYTGETAPKAATMVSRYDSERLAESDECAN